MTSHELQKDLNIKTGDVTVNNQNSSFIHTLTGLGT